MTRMTARERRQARTREEILAAALAIIREEGPDQLTLRALARRVDYSPAGLYEYFDSKDDIIAAVCDEGSRRLLALMQAVPVDLPPADYLVELGLAYIAFARRNVDHFLLMFTQVEERGETPFEELPLDESYRLLLDAVQMALEVGAIWAPENSGRDQVAYGLWGLAHGLAMLQVTNLRGVAFDFAGADRNVLETHLRGLSG
jgi:AcrR family transcriptional regulator